MRMKRLSLSRRELLRALQQKAAVLIVLTMVLCSLALSWLVNQKENEAGYRLPIYARISGLVLEQPEQEQGPFLNHLLRLIDAKMDFYPMDDASAADYAALVDAGALPEEVYRLVSYRAAAQAVQDDLESVTGYKAYVTNIQKQSKRIQVLFRSSPNMGYQESNVIKTAKDYEPLLTVQPVFEQNAGHHLLHDSLTVTAWLLTIGTLLLSLSIHLGDSAYFPLFRSTRRGRSSLTFSKTAALLGLNTLMTIGAFAVLLAYAEAAYGLGHLDRPIQSIYSVCPWKISVGQYLWATLGFLLLTQWVMALLCGFLCVLFRHAVPVTGGLMAVLLVGAVLHQYVPEYSWAGVLKYLNPFAFLKGELFLQEYHNLNLFGRPVGLMPCVLIWAAGMILLPGGLSLLMARGNAATGKLCLRWPSFRPDRGETRGSTSLWAQEAWHFFIGQKALLLCVMLIMALALRGALFPLTLSPYEQYCRSLIEQASQQEDPGAWIASEYEKECTLNAGVDSLRGRALAAIMGQNAAIESLNNPNAVLLYDSGYKQLLNGTVNAEGTLIIAVVITFLSMLTAKEDIDTLLRTLPRRRGSRRAQCLLKLFTILFVFFLVLGADILRVQQTYSLSHVTASAASVLTLVRYESLSLLFFLTLMQLLRLAAFCLLALCLFRLSRRGYLLPLAVSLVLVLLPLLCAWIAPALAGAWHVNLLLQGRLLL